MARVEAQNSVVLSELNGLTEEISRNAWLGSEDQLAEIVALIFSSNSHDFRGVGQENQTLQNFVRALKGIKQTQKVTSAVQNIQEITRFGYASGQDFNLLSSRSPQEIKEIVEWFRNLIKNQVPDAKKYFALWVDYHEFEVSKLGLSKKELLDLAPSLSCLRLDLPSLTQEEIFNLVGQCQHLKKLTLATPTLLETPPLSPTVEYFRCDCQELKKVNSLHEGVKTVLLAGSPLVKELPPELPSSVERFSCADARYVEQLPRLNQGLKEVDCSGTSAAELPFLPSSLEVVDIRECEHMDIVFPNNVPEKLRILKISGSAIRGLPDPERFPHTMKEIYAENCPQLILPQNFKDEIAKRGITFIS